LGYLAAASISPGENAQFRDLNCSRRSHRSVALYQGTTLELAEKVSLLKGTGFSPYVSGCKPNRLQPLRGLVSSPRDFFRKLFGRALEDPEKSGL
jgi:hypothetical protein